MADTDAVGRRQLSSARALRTRALPAPIEEPRGELLFEFGRGRDRLRCELRDHGSYGVEALIRLNGEFLNSHRFDGGGSRIVAAARAIEWAVRRVSFASFGQPDTSLAALKVG